MQRQHRQQQEWSKRKTGPDANANEKIMESRKLPSLSRQGETTTMVRTLNPNRKLHPIGVTTTTAASDKKEKRRDLFARAAEKRMREKNEEMF
jgi:hypothetical protein